MSKQQTVMVVGIETELGRETAVQLKVAGYAVAGICAQEQVCDELRQQGWNIFTAPLDDVGRLVTVMSKVNPAVVMNLGSQMGNTLLHDGHDWRDVQQVAQRTQALVKAVQGLPTAAFLIHASYAFLYGNGPTVDEQSPLRPLSDDEMMKAGARAEQLVAENGRLPFTILRLGYLYGPQSYDLKLYEFSFQLQRPYYAGPQEHRAHYVHFSDAAAALVRAAEVQAAGRIINIVDGERASFGDFVDRYAKQLGRWKPSRIPTSLVKFAPLLITPQQVRMLTLTADALDYGKAHRLLGWEPVYKSYKEGLAQSVQVMKR